MKKNKPEADGKKSDMALGVPIIRLNSVDSTNNYLKKHPELWDRQFCAVMAYEQTGGRGRYARTWHSEPGLDITFSVVFLPAMPPEDLSCVTLYAGLAVHRALRHLDSSLSLKWPNDICHINKKIGGILCEMILSGEKPVVIIGIGINVNSTRFPDDLSGTASSLKMITGFDHDPDLIAEEILDQIALLMPDFRVPMDESVLSEWISVSTSIGSVVTFSGRGGEELGVIKGINPDGSLRITDSRDGEVNFYRGEIIFIDAG
ncbi:MAG: biotin--[acetyl-CoA-carboxylase] ligase [Spirochaetes bacterium RBG_13_51_14]|nr:MAG: biotin--[acetyl-CoA-carboxylase] ligase [Spirochaetes bacterium RBG_13_51_14]